MQYMVLVLVAALAAWPFEARGQAADSAVDPAADSAVDPAADSAVDPAAGSAVDSDVAPAPAPAADPSRDVADPSRSTTEPIKDAAAGNRAVAARANRKKSRDKARTDLRGRVFVRNTISKPDTRLITQPARWSNQLGIDSARLGLKYRNRKLGLRIEVEAEFAEGKGEVRDAYVRLQPRPYVRVQAGRFKVPISAVALASRWSLPVTERGIVGEFELANELTAEPDRLPVGGRNIGVQVELRSDYMNLEPRLFVGVFRSRVHAQLEGALGENRLPLSLGDGFPEDVYARVEFEPMGDVQVGVSLGWIGMLDTAGTRDTFAHGYVGGLDVVADIEPFRLWLEGFLGDSPLHLGTNLLAQGGFAAARAIVAVRIPMRAMALRYVEPHAMAQYLDGSSEYDETQAYQVGGGINLGFSKSWRVQLTADHSSVGNRLVGGGTRFIIQLGAVF